MLARRALVALLAVLGVAALAVGTGMRTVWLPPDTVTATADLSEGPVALTAPGVLEMRDGPVAVELAGEGVVHLARMREEDAVAWVGEAAHTTVTGLSSQTALSTEVTEGEPTVPDPAGSVMWLDSETGEGEVSTTWEDEPGRYLLVAAGDGTQAPQQLSLTWPLVVSTPWATPLVVLGVVLLVLALGLGLLVELRGKGGRRARRDAAADEPAAPTAPTTHPEEVRP